jgi:4-hydroxybenzoate polyprenyltransferase
MARWLGAEVGALVRGRNLAMAAAGVAIGGILAMGRVALPRELVLAMLSAAGLGAAGNAANDLWDVAADRINKPHRPLPSGAVSRDVAVAVGGIAGGAGLLLAWLAGRTTLAIALPALAVMLAYSPLLKPRSRRRRGLPLPPGRTASHRGGGRGRPRPKARRGCRFPQCGRLPWR